ncbi:MAG: hypothetical protein V1820_04415 [archaeon]
MLKLVPLFAYDTPHCVSAARKIIEERPDVVTVEVPEDFQPVFDGFLAGRISEGRLIKLLGGGKVDRKVLFGKRPLLLSYPKAAIEYIAVAAKHVGARVVAVDIRFSSAREILAGSLIHSKKGRLAALNRAERAIDTPDPGLTGFFEFIHAPFHFFELVVGHAPSRDRPGTHPAGCRMCTAGVYWEKFFYEIYALFTNLFNPVGEAKYVSALKYFETLRESKIARKIARTMFPLPDSRKRKKREPRVLAILHLWHSRPVFAKLRKLGLKPTY